jgi:hypothetical protein
MKKGKLLAVVLIALLLAGGLVLASCRAGCDGAGDCTVKDGKGSICFNINSTNRNTCAANKAVSEKKNGNCDC